MDLVFVALPHLRNATLRSGQRVKEKSAWKPCRQSFGSGLTLPEAETTGPVIRVVSMGRRNTQVEPDLH